MSVSHTHPLRCTPCGVLILVYARSLWDVTCHEYREFSVLCAKSGVPVPVKGRKFHVEPTPFVANITSFTFIPERPNLVAILFAASNTVRPQRCLLPP